MYLEKQSSNSLYTRWTEMRRRCRKPRQASYIKKNIWWSAEFDRFEDFRLWALRVGFDESLSLDRIDNSLGYTPENCKWSSKQEQQYNQHKKTLSNATSQYRGVSRYKGSTRWRCRIYINGKETVVGYFDTEIEAALAYNNALNTYKINAPRNEVLTLQ